MLNNAGRLQKDRSTVRYRRGDRRRGAGFLRKIGPRAQRRALDRAPPHQAARLCGDEETCCPGTISISPTSSAIRSGVTVYLCLPASRMGLCNRWLRIFINQLLDAMERETDRAGSAGAGVHGRISGAGPYAPA